MLPLPHIDIQQTLTLHPSVKLLIFEEKFIKMRSIFSLYSIMSILFSLSTIHCRLISSPFMQSIFPQQRHKEPTFEEENDASICNSKSCVSAAQHINKSVNISVNPCDDFYSFACGKWIESHPVPPTENYLNQFEILSEDLDRQLYEMLQESIRQTDAKAVNDAKIVFQTCMNEERMEERGLEPIINLLEKLGGWPMAGWNDKRLDWTRLVAQSISLLADAPLLLVYVAPDKKNTTRNIIKIDQPFLVLPRFALAESDDADLGPYVEYVADTAALIAEAYEPKLSPSAVHMEAMALVKFEKKLAKITKKDEHRRDANKMYNLLTIAELQEYTDKIPVLHKRSQVRWLKFLKQAMGESGIHLNLETEVVVTDLAFISHLLLLIDVTPLRVIVNYVQWRIVRTMSRDLTRGMRSLNFRFQQKTSRISVDQPRWRECVTASNYMGFAMGYMYVSRRFSHAVKEKVEIMMDDIRAAFRQELEEISWMDIETKTAALEKADFMNYFIGYPNWYHNDSALAYYYEGLEIGENHFENKIRLRSFIVQKASEKLNKPTDRLEWLLSPAVVNAFYNSIVNSIIFPAAILQPPFFDVERPESLNYGSIGAIMGHEISHGFDDLGRQSDKLGNIHQWWSKETEETYLKNAQCFINQYQNYRIPELDVIFNRRVTMNGVLTLGENIADNGGLRSAYRAWKVSRTKNGGTEKRLKGLEHISPDQLFFLGFANVWCESTTKTSLAAEVMGDTHAPHKQRVIGTLSNSIEFAEAWKCPRGSPMNPDRKCLLW